jgi:hypothetical protein
MLITEREVFTLGNFNIEFLQFWIQIKIQKDQNKKFELDFEICERNEN